MKIALIYSRRGMPDSWAIQHTIMRLLLTVIHAFNIPPAGSQEAGTGSRQQLRKFKPIVLAIILPEGISQSVGRSVGRSVGQSVKQTLEIFINP